MIARDRIRLTVFPFFFFFLQDRQDRLRRQDKEDYISSTSALEDTLCLFLTQRRKDAKIRKDSLKDIKIKKIEISLFVKNRLCEPLRLCAEKSIKWPQDYLWIVFNPPYPPPKAILFILLS